MRSNQIWIPGFTLLLAAAPLKAADTGWNVTTPGTYSYTDTDNWAGGTINDTFDATLSLTDDGTNGSQILIFGVDYATTGGLSFSYADPNTTGVLYNFTFRSDGLEDRTFTLNGDLTYSPVRNRMLTVGSLTEGENLALNLGGGVRTFSINTNTGTLTGSSAADPNTGVTLNGVISNGAIVKTGTGWLRIGGNQANTSFVNVGDTPALTVTEGVVSLRKPTGTVAVGGDILVNGGVLFFSNPDLLADETNMTITSGSVYFAATAGSGSGNTPKGQTFNNLVISGGLLNTSPKSNGSAPSSQVTNVLGDMTVSGGTVAIRNSVFNVGSLQISGGAITITSVGTGLDSSSERSRLVIGEGGLEITNIESGAFTPISANTWGSVFLAGNLVFNGNETNTETTTIAAAAPGASPNVREFGLQGATRTFTINDGAADVDLLLSENFTIVNGTGTGGIIKNGAGTLQVDSAGTYTGPTEVNAGRLLINGEIDSAATVNAGVLGGTGFIKGGLTVNGGSVNPGSAEAGSIGTLTVGNTALAGGELTINIGAEGTSDLLAVVGDLDLSSLNDALTIVGLADNSTYTIATYTGVLTGVFDSLALPSSYAIDYGTGSNSAITISVPEPAGLGIVALAACGLLSRRRGKYH